MQQKHLVVLGTSLVIAGETLSFLGFPVSFSVFLGYEAPLLLILLGLVSLIAYLWARRVFFVKVFYLTLLFLSIIFLVLLFSVEATFTYVLNALAYMGLSWIVYRAVSEEGSQVENSSSKIMAMDKSKSSEYVVELIDVKKDYVVGPIIVHALRGINMKIRRGEFVAIMGPSGSGKSTLLNLIGALDRPTSGKIIIDGVDISQLSEDELAEFRNKKIGFIFQQFNLITRTTVLRNIELPAIVAGVPPEERRRRALELLRLVGLTKEEAIRRPVYLSGGQQQRVAIVRALMNNPSIILADEPTGNLDSKTGAEIVKLLREMNEKFGTTIILVTHDKEVARAADRILYIRDGKIVGEEILRREKYVNSS
ncbi:MAG: ABC transporter ATP-binding protein [Candidatus Njordarchaeales archaeon]